MSNSIGEKLGEVILVSDSSDDPRDAVVAGRVKFISKEITELGMLLSLSHPMV